MATFLDPENDAEEVERRITRIATFLSDRVYMYFSASRKYDRERCVELQKSIHLDRESIETLLRQELRK